MQTATAKIPPLIRSARFVLAEGLAHVDNFTGAIVHDKKVERALAAVGRVPFYYQTEDDETPDNDAPIVVKRSHGGRKLNPVLLDTVTANMIVTVWDSINEENRARFPILVKKFAVTGTVTRLWKLIKKK